MRLSMRLLSSVVNKRPYFISTPIFYVNAKPHIGHLYTALLADAVQRFEKLINPELNVIFSTGTDEHGTKIQQAADKAGVKPRLYCDNISKEYKDLFREYSIDHTDFVRTTEERHMEAVKQFWNRLVERDHIYKANYSGWYSVNDESFVPEAHVKDELRDGQNVKVSIESGHKVEWMEESNYMFRLSAFKNHLQNWLKTDGVIAPQRFQKQLQEYLANEAYFPDISVSRPTARVHWAIPVPGDEEQSIYVWLDALINYLTVCGYPDEDVMKARGRPWPADLHVVGKDILKFHGIYWPAFLMAANMHPPRKILCHAHWTVDGVKMSKSLGNTVDPKAWTGHRDAPRYLLLREHTLYKDANFSETKLINTINAELADTLGNLLSRCCGKAINPRQEFPMLHIGELASARQCSTVINLMEAVERLPDDCREYYSTYQFYKAVDAVIHTLHLANLFFETQRPWEMSKRSDCQKELDVVLHLTMESLRICAIILQPVIPNMAEKLLDKLQVATQERSWQHCEKISWLQMNDIFESKKIQTGKSVLFPRIYTDKKAQKKVLA